MRKTQLATLALGALMIAPILAAPVMQATASYRLVGVYEDGEREVVNEGLSYAACAPLEGVIGADEPYIDGPLVVHCEQE